MSEIKTNQLIELVIKEVTDSISVKRYLETKDILDISTLGIEATNPKYYKVPYVLAKVVEEDGTAVILYTSKEAAKYFNVHDLIYKHSFCPLVWEVDKGNVSIELVVIHE